MKKIFWILVLGAVGSAAMAVSLGHAADVQNAKAAKGSKPRR